jgi:dTDP-glucose pyrophosphorylase
MYLGLKEVTSAHIITYQDLRKYLKEFQKGDYDCYIILEEIEDPIRFGVAKFDSNGRLINVVEKPKQLRDNRGLLL